jgi:hypothetical protein
LMNSVQSVQKVQVGVTPRVWTDFGGEFRMPSGRKKGVVDERAEKVFSGIQAAGHWGVA